MHRFGIGRREEQRENGTAPDLTGFPLFLAIFFCFVLPHRCPISRHWIYHLSFLSSPCCAQKGEKKKFAESQRSLRVGLKSAS
ncbi:hypothetical protein IEQ34_014335 [Dendrobium chrysotoxum]|uniref:Uncharacterized protein n=1 Tax=Dendrobium chrysotoxum TaxID=161865 RepID=A0AAV7GLD6_DENCH|nr:hypothetical protein IEQ34_014335 [Dendrobium chrysotoxum]